MARLNQMFDSDDDLPELSTILRSSTKATTSPIKKPVTKQDESKTSPRKKYCNDGNAGVSNGDVFSQGLSRLPFDANRFSNQRPLGLLKATQVNSLSLPIAKNFIETEGKVYLGESLIRSSPKRKAKTQVDYSKFAPRLSDVSLSSSESDDTFTDLSGFIVPDSASDVDVFPSRSQKSKDGKSFTKKTGDKPSKKDSCSHKVTPFEGKEDTGPIELTSPSKEKTLKMMCAESPPRFRTPPRLSESDRVYSGLDEPFSKLRFSPPRSKSPHKSKDDSKPITPPSNPSKSKLQSPSKRHRIPPSPHRPSIDAFWCVDVVNDWNEQYSPRKPLRSPRKNGLYSLDEDEDELSPSESPRKSTNRSPAKRDKKAIERRKAFEETKHDLASFFLAEVDQVVGEGQVSALAESTGGIKIIWSKKLSSTAGRANWRREAIRSKNEDGTLSTATHRHHASIELAEKVIDDEDRLTNVIAHEYCHLANFMISGIKDNPHGASFKTWAAKATRAFKHRNINVTTKHAYEIAYKYIWVCSSESCGLEYKRHSKSIDPTKHSCGSCKAKLVQVQPVPRRGEGEGKRSEYQNFVKREHERVRMENPGMGFGEIMAILGREFKECKKDAAAVRDAEEKSESIAEVRVIEGADLDQVARKLDFLNLEA